MIISIKDSRVELDVIQYEDQTKYNIMVSKNPTCINFFIWFSEEIVFFFQENFQHFATPPLLAEGSLWSFWKWTDNGNDCTVYTRIVLRKFENM